MSAALSGGGDLTVRDGAVQSYQALTVNLLNILDATTSVTFGGAIAATTTIDVASGGTDCDDTNSDVHPGANEACNLVDENCDGEDTLCFVDGDCDGAEVVGGGGGEVVVVVGASVVVVVVDADLQFGDVCIAMQVDPVHTIVEASRELDELDEELLESLLTTHASGLKILAAPLEPSLADGSGEILVLYLTPLLRTEQGAVLDVAVLDAVVGWLGPLGASLETAGSVTLPLAADAH